MALEKKTAQKAEPKKMPVGENRDTPAILAGINAPAKATPEKKTRVNVDFDKSYHLRMKKACLEKDISMTDMIKQQIDRWLNENGM